MLQGEEGTVEMERGDRAATRALRLYRHAKLLLSQHHDTAAEERYRASASLAREHGRLKLAAHSMTRLSYFFMLRGRPQEALIAADEARTLHADPLARYLSATLRRELGDLRTDADVVAARKELTDITGQLPSPDLEKLRAAAEADLALWQSVTPGVEVSAEATGPTKCFTMGDAAQTLICLFGWCIFG
jgi:hypothetical protein